MGKYGIGARVRDEDGDEGVVVDKRKGERLVGEYGGKYTDGFTMWWDKAQLTPVLAEGPAEASPISAEKGEVAFSVGDRVVMDPGSSWGEHGIGEVVPADRDARKGLVGVIFHDDSFKWHFEPDELRPFRIEAGRFYRTRDGRKVGPMEEYYGGFIHRLGDGMKWNSDGTRVNLDHEDIVAEWVEPAVAVEAPQPKFKVGDRVDLMRDGKPVEQWSNMTITEIDRGEFVFPIKTDVGLPCFEHELRLSPDLHVGAEVTITGKLVAIDEEGDGEVHFDSLGYTLFFPATSLKKAA